jgi:signal transduction histidine kinase
MAPQAPVVLADGDRIKQVLINLVLNAIQATAEGGEVKITSHTAESRGRRLGQLQVQDTGVGIQSEHLDNIFNPFFTTKDKGTGLGLAIAHQIVNEHGGQLSVRSHVGVGTVFFLDLPLAEASERTSLTGSSGGAVRTARA